MINIEITDEQKIRKEWLVSYFIFTVCSLFYALANFLKDENMKHLYEQMNIPFNFFTCLVLAIISSIPSFLVLYYFPYKRRGTIILGLFLSLTLFSGLLELTNEIFHFLPFRNPVKGLVRWIFTASQIYFWVNCVRLYRVNSLRKKEKQF